MSELVMDVGMSTDEMFSIITSHDSRLGMEIYTILPSMLNQDPKVQNRYVYFDRNLFTKEQAMLKGIEALTKAAEE